MRIRKTRNDDGPIIRKLRIYALTDAPYAFGAKLEDVLLEPIEKFKMDALRHSESEISTSFLAFDNEQEVGMIGAFFEPSTGRAFICSLWVNPNFRGRYLARDFVETAAAWLKRRGAKECYAWVADTNISAVSFYKKIGFFNTGESQELPSDIEEREHLYCLQLSINHCDQSHSRVVPRDHSIIAEGVNRKTT